jgi:hypothetical protein
MTAKEWREANPDLKTIIRLEKPNFHNRTASWSLSLSKRNPQKFITFAPCKQYKQLMLRNRIVFDGLHP